jgi:hypothetical protein
LAVFGLLFVWGDASALARPRRNQPQCNKPPANQPPQQRRCSNLVFNRLYFDVGRFCKTDSRSCKQTDDCQSATKKVSLGYGCTNAREQVQQQCYRPGDPGYQGHMAQIAEANAALRKCLDVQADKCQ